MAKAFQSRWRQLLGIGRNTARRVAAALLLDPTVPVGNFPTGVAINSAGTLAYVANEGDDSVSVIDTATNAVIATINVGSSPFGVAVTPDGAFVYVTNVASDSVSVIDTATNAVTDTVSVGISPFGIAINAAGTLAYVANVGDNTVSVIDTSTNTVVTDIPVGANPFGVALTPDGAFAYVTNNASGTVSVVDTATNAEIDTIAVGTSPTGVAITSDGVLAYVTNNSDNTVSAIDIATNTVSDTFDVGSAPTSVAFTPDDAFAYVTNNASDTVSVVITATNDVTFDIPVGSGPFGVAITPDGEHAYVTNNASDTVSVTDTVPFPTTTTLTSAPDPSAFGEAKVLTATVTSSTGTPDGTVTFLDGATPLGTVTLAGGVATLTTSSLAVGSHSLTADYAGNVNFSVSTSAADIQTVNAADTATTLTSSPDPSVFGEAKVLTATVTAVAPGSGTPTGSVSFLDGATVIGIGTLDGGGVATFSTSSLSAGTHSLTAVYAGDGSFNGSTSPVDTQTVTAANTTTALTSSPDPSVFGQAKVLTATVTAVAPGAGVPTGTVTFFDGMTSLGTGTLDGSGVATLSVSNLSVGAHSLTAGYAGTADYNSSTSAVDSQTVTAANTTTALTSSPDPSVFGQAKVLTATVSAVAPGAGVPTGTVTFFDGMTSLGTGTLNGSGVATLSVSNLSVGAHSLTAGYAGTADYNSSTSAVDSQTVTAANTTTALTSSPDPSVFGQAKVLTATVSAVAPGAGVPTGTVTFFDGMTSLGTGTLNGSGVATLSVSNLSVGAHSLTAGYAGTADYNSSTSAVDSQTVTAANTTTALTSSPDPSVFGQGKVLTATVSAVAPGAGVPTGTVTFFDGMTSLGTGILVGSGVATLSVSNLSVGSHALTAAYGGDTSYNGSTSPIDTQTVNAADTATALTSSPDPSVFGEAKVLTATVSAVAPGAGVPTGTVTFFDGMTSLGTGILNGSGVATLSVSNLSVGSHALTAAYGGDTSYNGSTSPIDTQTVNAADTTTALTSSPDPSVFGETKVLTATVTPVAPGTGVPTGTVTFFDGMTSLGTGTLDGSGVATLSVSNLSVGTHPLTAAYGGDTSYNGSTSPVDTQTVNAADTATALTSSPDPSVFGEAKVLTATVTAVAPGSGTPTGSVSFLDGATVIGIGTLDGGGVATFTTSSLSAGTHSLTAVYAGDGSFNGSTSPVDTQTVNAANTTTALTSSPDPSVFGEAKVLTATVSAVAPGAGVPTGTVTFFDGMTSLGTGTLDGSGVATLSVSNLSVGSHALTAAYGGDTSYNGSTSPIDTQTVNAADTATALTSSPDPSVFGEAKVLTATVSAVAPGAGVPTGTVTFFDGMTSLGTGILDGSGVATLSVSNLSVGTHPLTAAYGGDTSYNGSTSPIDTQTVNAANTTTALTSSPDPSVFGETKVLTATVTPVAPGTGVPTGTVTFFDGMTSLGTGTLDGSGVATLSVSNLSVGTHPLTAAYGGDTSYNGSTSPVDTQTVNAADTATALTSSPDPSVFGEAKVLTATVTAVAPGSGTPTGSVSFLDGATVIGIGTLDGGGVATFTTSSLSAGTHSLTAVYAGDGSFNGSTSPVDTQTVNAANTTTALTSSPDPSVFGEAKVLTATVSAVAPGAGVPTGTVTFFDGMTSLGTGTLDGSGVATLSVSNLSVGTHPLTAAYGGDTSYNGSTSPTDTQTVNAADTTTALTSSPDPSVFGQTKVLTATVSAVAPGAGVPTGTVTFFDGMTSLGTGTLDGTGVATLSVSNLSVGTHPLTATYAGDTSYNGSTSPIDTQTVNAADTATTLTSSPDPSVFGQAKVLTATVSPVAPGGGIPTGTVTFFDGMTSLGTGTLDGTGVATLSVSNLSVGTHPLTATYGGDSSFNGSTSPADTQTVNAANTTTALTSSPDPSVFGQGKVLTATVSPVAPGGGIPTGTVTFFDGMTSLGTGTLDGSGVATLTVSNLSVGSHALTATYGGDSSFNGSTSPADTQTVNAANTTTTLTSSPDPSVFGEAKVLTATVTAVAPGSGTPTGSVSFLDGATVIGIGTLDGGGVATFTTSTLGAGTHSLTAVYAGDGSFNGSTSPVDTQTVNAANTTTALTSSPDPSVFGQGKVLTATVSPVAPGGGIPTGTVTFFDGMTSLGTGTLNGSGVATLTVSNLSVGSHSLTATYGGDSSFNGSTSPADTQTVNAADTTTALTSSPDPSVFGQTKVLTATVSAVAPGAGVPTGTVTFFDGMTSLGTGTLDGTGVATLSVSNLSVGTHPLTATYGGDTSYNGSTSPADTQTVNTANTTATLTSSPDPSVFGQTKVLTATVTPVAPGTGVPTGTVTFFDGMTSLGTGTLDGSGVATLSVSNLSVGTHPLTAAYGGDTSHNGSTSPIDTQTVNAANTTTALTSSPDPSVFGQTKVLTATVTPVAPGTGVPTGTVTFFDGMTSLGTGTLNGSGVATLSVSNLSVGTHPLTAAYGGDTSHNGSTSPVDTQTVNKANTTTAVSSSPNPSVFGQSVNLTATVAVVAPGGGVPGGTVTFFVGGIPQTPAVPLNGSGVATLSISTLSVGTRSVRASYNGSAGYNTSTSPTISQVVSKANTSTTLTSSPDPSVFGQTKVLTATVSPVAPGGGTPIGTVSFFDGMTLLGTGTLSGGVATLSTSALALGSHSLTATYGGSANFNGSTSPVDTQTVNPANTTTVLTSSPDPSVLGQAKVLTATVSATAPGAGTPSGTVTFFDGMTSLGTGALDGSGVATLSVSNLSVGSHTLTATYGGSANFNGSTSAVDTQTVNPANTMTALTSSPDPSVTGQAKVLTATVTAVAPGTGTPSGSVTFFDGMTSLGTGTLDGSGVATLSVSNLSVGNHSLTAAYGGSGSYNGSTSSADTQTVNKANTTTAVSSSPNPSVFGQSVNLTATVAVVAPGGGVPGGTVTFFIGGIPQTPAVPLNGSGVATLPISTLSVGTRSVRASYNGSAGYNTSTSPTISQVVSKANTSTTLVSAPNPSMSGQSVTLTATVAPVAPGGGVPTGSVSFLDGMTLLGTGTLSGGVATFSTSSLSVGSHSLTAAYAGSGSYNGSTSPAVTQTVS
ncbi:YVTN family beta-propeller protein [Streptomyces sp. Ag109_O5-1]|uniref:Ig-like domain repeat protein n=1 Tax=Streptomyces sp. Ag109_O5-1 TaxID=1938851 RepID=UPI000F4FDAE6|nr:Ig-like domain repeat protein [Streptomyces sp. Ag109_O5-1]RPE37315.1 YVTN family beta-propeller protein [Streptomyces sp. Ag109_O5-1]